MAKKSLEAIRRKFKETHPGTDEWIEFTITDRPDATTYRLHHPLFQTNDEKRAMRRAQEASDDFLMARALLGDQYEQFESEGGQVSDVLLLIMDISETMSDTDDQGNPTLP